MVKKLNSLITIWSIPFIIPYLWIFIFVSTPKMCSYSLSSLLGLYLPCRIEICKKLRPVANSCRTLSNTIKQLCGDYRKKKKKVSNSLEIFFQQFVTLIYYDPILSTILSNKIIVVIGGQIWDLWVWSTSKMLNANQLGK